MSTRPSKVTKAEIKKITNPFLKNSKNESKKVFEEIIIRLTSDIKKSELKVVKNPEGKNIAIIGREQCQNDIFEIPILRISGSIGTLRNTLFYQLIYDTVNEAVKANQKIIKVSEPYLDDEYRLTLNSFGFFPDNKCWIKISLNGLIDSKELLKSYPFISTYPNIKAIIDQISELSGTIPQHTKLSLERLLYPLIFTDLNIPVYIVPIKPYWASQLFDTPSANQMLFGAAPELAWNRTNVYYRSKQLSGLTFPARIIWYLSEQNQFSRKKHAVALSYLDKIEINPAKLLFKKHWRYGVYKWNDLLKQSKNKPNDPLMAILFSDTQLYTNPIPYSRLKQILFDSCSKSYTFQSPVKISHQVFLHMHRIGMEPKK